ncbi:NAD(P)-binding protein [Teratosphaeria nubilosa]|uniref:NAD(P)-binding protein n=1 Tax=Teratosphaeria nubilosa TaxID=161662 RepID=A0A6G1L248_9PEZI|nr:NAD(P)-binding protein [Teratosphaeria nubilosa]
MSKHITTSDKPWHAHITLDLLVLVLQRSIFHPFIAWLIPLCQRAVGAPSDNIYFIATSIYASLITLLWLLSVFDNRIAYGKPREVNWDEEVVVITGGASGLGKILAETYGMRGASVAVLDVQKPQHESEALENVRFSLCDVSDATAVSNAAQQISKDLSTPTILINNAGIVTGKPLLSLTTPEITRTLHINLLSHFHTLRAFLPGMLTSPNGGTIVTIASVLGKLGASHLSDYTASKAGLIAMHASLRAELTSPKAPNGAEKIRTILVTPGQLSTSLFEGVQTPSSFFGPVVEPVELAREIVKMVDAGESGEISLPLYARYIDWLHVLPAGLAKIARWASGMDRAMEGLTGRRDAVETRKDR